MTNREGLAEFLRSRRGRLTPDQAGITPFPGARRVQGLRRSELAVLASISPDYYTRLEQGRQENISVAVVDGLAKALRLTDVETDHLRNLASPPREPVAAASSDAETDGLLRVMAALDHQPALLLDRRDQVITSNALLDEVLGHAFRPGESFAHFLLCAPTARQRICDWPSFARAALANLRRETALRPDDADLIELIGHLRQRSDAVDNWWADLQVEAPVPVRKQIQHPTAGLLEFWIDTVVMAAAAQPRLVVYSSTAGSPTAKALHTLRA